MVGKRRLHPKLITIEWYNLIAIFTGVLFGVLIVKSAISKDKSLFPAAPFYIIVSIIFYLIFGGVFWW